MVTLPNGRSHAHEAQQPGSRHGRLDNAARDDATRQEVTPRTLLRDDPGLPGFSCIKNGRSVSAWGVLLNHLTTAEHGVALQFMVLRH